MPIEIKATSQSRRRFPTILAPSSLTRFANMVQHLIVVGVSLSCMSPLCRAMQFLIHPHPPRVVGEQRERNRTEQCDATYQVQHVFCLFRRLVPI